MTATTYEIRNLRTTDTGLTGGSFVDGDVYVDVAVDEAAAVWEEHNNLWAPYGTSPDMWHSAGNALDEVEIETIADAIYDIGADPADFVC